MAVAIPQQCWVIGDPIEQSLSPLVHTAGYVALGIQNKFSFRAHRVPADALAATIQNIRDQNITGISVTLPHKSAVMPYLDIVDATARHIGAVNTILQTDGQLCGYNTDWLGVLLPLQSITDARRKKAVVIGAGGAARATVFALLSAGTDVTVYNRTVEKAAQLAREFDVAWNSWDHLEEIQKSDIIVQTTPIGMIPDTDEIPLPIEYIQAGQIVFDVVYHPIETKLLRLAKTKGATVISGAEMFLQQAAEQFKLYTNQPAPLGAMRRALLGYLLSATK